MKFLTKYFLNIEVIVISLLSLSLIIQGAAIGLDSSSILLTPRIPTRLAKAGSKLKPEFSIPEKLNNSSEKLEHDAESSVEDFEEYEELSDNNVCEEGMYWYIRGGRCVPERCPERRDPVTGNCISDWVRAFGSNRYPRYYGGSWLRNRLQHNRGRGGRFYGMRKG